MTSISTNFCYIYYASYIRTKKIFDYNTKITKSNGDTFLAFWNVHLKSSKFTSHKKCCYVIAFKKPWIYQKVISFNKWGKHDKWEKVRMYPLHWSHGVAVSLPTKHLRAFSPVNFKQINRVKFYISFFIFNLPKI